MNTETMKAAMSLAAEKELPTLYFTDIPSLNVVQAMLAECTGISHHKIEGRECLSKEERQFLNEKMKSFSKIPLYVEEYSSLTQLKELFSKVNDCIRVYGVKAVIIDIDQQ